MTTSSTSSGRRPWRSGRPPIQNPKSKTVKLRVTPEELSSLTRIARAGDMSMSDLVRQGALLLGARYLRANDIDARLATRRTALMPIVRRKAGTGLSVADKAVVAQTVSALLAEMKEEFAVTPRLGRTLSSLAINLTRVKFPEVAPNIDALLARIDAIMSRITR